MRIPFIIDGISNAVDGAIRIREIKSGKKIDIIRAIAKKASDAVKGLSTPIGNASR
jgi:hypothetical protein